MSEVELPSLADAARLVLLGAPFLLLALRKATAMLPTRAAPAHRWTRTEVLAVSSAPILLFIILGVLTPVPGVFAGLLLNELVLGLTTALAIALATRRSQGLASLGLGSGTEPRAFLAAPIVYVPLLFVSLGLTFAWLHVCRARGWEEQQDVLLAILALEGPELVLACVIASVVGPLLEELLFRGFLQSVLGQSLGERGALVGTSVLFAMLHGMAGLPALFVLSLFLGWLQQRTRCLWVPWSAHVLNNAVALGIALASQDHAG